MAESSTGRGSGPDPSDDISDLVASVLLEETRRGEERATGGSVVLADDLIAGAAGEGGGGLRQALRAGGPGLLTVLFLLNVVDEWPRVAMLVLLPDIQKTFDVSNTTVLGVSGLFGLVLVLGALPFGALGDRWKRVRILTLGAFIWATFTVLMGLAPSMFLMALFVIGNGFGQASRLPNANSLLADGYPIASRNTVFALESSGRPVGQFVGPFLAGAIAGAAGGLEGWRWAFFAFAGPPILLLVATLFLKEPARGANEQRDVLGEELGVDEGAPPISLSAAFQRLKKVKTFYYLVVGLGVMGFGLFAAPGLVSLLLEEEYGYGAFTRGWMLGLGWLPAILVLPFVGRLGDRLFRKAPERVLRLAGFLIGGYGILFTLALLFDQPAVFLVFYALANGCQASAFALTSPTIATVVPYRMRSMAFALVGLYLTLIGGIGGNLLGGSISDQYTERTALLTLIPPSIILGGALVVYGSRFVRRDIALVVEELLEEQEERQRLSAAPGSMPVLQVRNLDYSYGPVQVLFGCDLDVHEGECVALLGNNGAGKSTLLRAISGLGIPDRGVIRLRGRSVTYTPAEWRVSQGVIQMRGGAGIFPGLTVEENLELFVTNLRLDRAEEERRRRRVYEIFPILEERRHQRAGNMSGGQRQMLALATALLHDPDVLIIDELSLGLAPVVVQELIAVVEQLRAGGQTMIIVEQSVNIALSLADRALFMEKGRVVFEGSAADLAQRDDLVQAVFLGGGGA
jgi:ABC-type branched-subunit amino acid transport system ATPase component/predicted MFS family arabinose efflux permease